MKKGTGSAPTAASFLVLALAGSPVAQAASPKAVAKYETYKTKILYECGQRHLRLGDWCRDNGLVPQAIAQFERAREASDGRNRGAEWLAGKRRSMGEAFWKGRAKKVSSKMLRAYRSRDRTVEKANRKDRLKLADRARKIGHTDEAARLYDQVIAASNEPLRFDKKGGLKLEAGKVPAEYAEKYQEEAVTINGELWRRDEFLSGLPAVVDIHESATDRLRVRSEVSLEHAEDLHALGSALLDHLEQEIGGAPADRMQLFVFAKRDGFRSYQRVVRQVGDTLESVTDHRGVVVTCAEDCSEDDLRGVVLRGWTAQFDREVSNAKWPTWYGLALQETYGGPGTFAWDGKRLELGGLLGDASLDPLRATSDLFDLEQILLGHSAWLDDPKRVGLFRSHCWAFLRYLRSGAGPEVAEEFVEWEAGCRGDGMRAAVDASHERKSPADLFEGRFGARLTELQDGFRAWLATL